MTAMSGSSVSSTSPTRTLSASFESHASRSKRRVVSTDPTARSRASTQSSSGISVTWQSFSPASHS